MKRWKLLIAMLAISLGFGLASATPIMAAQTEIFEHVPCDGSNGTSAVCNSDGDPITGSSGVLARVTVLIAYISGIAAIIIIIIGGVMYVLSEGDSSKITAAKNTILYAVIGLVVVILARTIILFVVGKIK